MSTLTTVIQGSFGSSSDSRDEKKIKGMQIGEKNSHCFQMT